MIRSVGALDRLCFIPAVTTLYLTAQGTEVTAQNKRRIADPHWFRGHSCLRIGWDRIREILTKGGKFIANFHLCGGPDPEPAQASKKQGEKRKRRFTHPDSNVLIL
jgi:hypothetical protein